MMLLCLPIVGKGGPAAPGSVPSSCSACHQPVWISAAGQAVLKTDNPRVMCVSCGMAVYNDDDDARFAMAAGVADEVEAILGPGSAAQAQQIVDGLNRAGRRAKTRRKARWQ